MWLVWVADMPSVISYWWSSISTAYQTLCVSIISIQNWYYPFPCSVLILMSIYQYGSRYNCLYLWLSLLRLSLSSDGQRCANTLDSWVLSALELRLFWYWADTCVNWCLQVSEHENISGMFKWSLRSMSINQFFISKEKLKFQSQPNSHQPSHEHDTITGYQHCNGIGFKSLLRWSRPLIYRYLKCFWSTRPVAHSFRLSCLSCASTLDVWISNW